MFFLERVVRRCPRSFPIQAEQAPQLTGHRVVLNVLTCADNESYYALYASIDAYARVSERVLRPNETPDAFAMRIVSRCDMLWTIRLIDKSDEIVGDCALHKWDKNTGTIAFGGALIPTFWGQGIMAEAFQLIADYAKTVYSINSLRCSVSPVNSNALRFAQKMGFMLVHRNSQRHEFIKYV